MQEAKRSTLTFTWCVFSGTFQFVSFDYMSNQNNFWGIEIRMVGCDLVKQKKEKKKHSPVVTWELFSLSMYHSCEWQTLIFYLSKVKACESCFFPSPHYGCVFFFIIRLFYSFECVWLFCIYSMYMLGLMCMWCRIFCIWHSSACTVHIFIFPTCSSLKIKRNGNLKLYVICSEWAAACKHWYGPLIFSHPHGRQMTERKWGRQNNITIIIIVIL